MALSMNRTACNANKKGGLFSRPRLRGKDLNLRPLGYEPNELPLLHPAVFIHYTVLDGGRQWGRTARIGVNPAKKPRRRCVYGRTRHVEWSEVGNLGRGRCWRRWSGCA